MNHRGTEHAEVAQRRACMPSCKAHRSREIPTRKDRNSAIHFCGVELFRHLRQFVGEGVDHELEPIGNAELCIDGAEMVRDGGWANEESFGNLSILESLCNQRDDLSFPVCQS